MKTQDSCFSRLASEFFPNYNNSGLRWKAVYVALVVVACSVCPIGAIASIIVPLALFTKTTAVLPFFLEMFGGIFGSYIVHKFIESIKKSDR